MSGRLKNYCLPVATALVILACLYGFSPNFRYASGPSASPYGGDFLQEWLGGWIVRAGEYDRFYDARYAYALQHDPSLVGFAWNEDEYLPVVYPPFYYLLISPLSYIPLHAAAWVWAGLMAAALAGSLALLLQWGRTNRRFVPPQRGQFLPWLIPAAVFFAPVLESLSSSQKGTLCLLILTATFIIWNRGREFTAGLVLGLLAFKPQLLLVFTASAIWKRQWKFLAGLTTTCALLVGLSLCLGVEVCWQYVQFALGTGDYMQTSGYDLHKSHSIWGFAALLMPQASAGMRTCFSLLMAGLVAYQLKRIKDSDDTCRTDRQSALQFSGLVIATVLLSPHLFTYDLTVLLLPMFLMLMHAGKEASAGNRRDIAWAIGLLFISPAISTTLAATIGVQLTVPLMLYLLSLATRCQTSTAADRARASTASFASP